MSMRKEFEAWILGKNKSASLSLCTAEEGYVYSVGEYKNELIQVSWSAWQASRASMVIELPVINDKEWANTHAERCAMRDAIGFCKKRIEAAGLAVKP